MVAFENLPELTVNEYSVQLTFREQWLDERLKFNDFEEYEICNCLITDSYRSNKVPYTHGR
ncbi:hypothetical protein RUM43_007421 [Polyplax serrata]|uniref:Uncharacterized protein n=1 Tax=Polyplax serrata TaxID=468196 RepID=A0AAN8SA65_POLSC